MNNNQILIAFTIISGIILGLLISISIILIKNQIDKK
jgi:capsular polysaccharide biosynthesis protein